MRPSSPMDYTERVPRQRITAIPAGEYRAEGFLDDDGNTATSVCPSGVRPCQGRPHRVDLTASADQVETGFDVPFDGSTKVALGFCAIRSLLLDAETSDVKAPRRISDRSGQ